MTTVQCKITLNNEFINSIIYKSNWWERGEGVGRGWRMMGGGREGAGEEGGRR